VKNDLNIIPKLSAQKKELSIKIASLNGNVVFETEMLNDRFIVDCKHLKAGMYILTIIDEKNIMAAKFVKY
jgi:hypothetical protein